MKEPQLLNATKSEPEPLAHELPITVQTKQVHTIGELQLILIYLLLPLFTYYCCMVTIIEISCYKESNLHSVFLIFSDLSDEEEEVVVLNMLDPNDAQNKMSKKKKFTPKKETTQSVCQKSRTRRKNRNKK